MNKDYKNPEDLSTTFSKEDWENFFEMIEHPPEPTERFIRAARKYEELIYPQDVM